MDIPMRSYIRLNEQQTIVLQGILKDKSTKEIAKGMQCPENTVNNVRRALRSIFGVKSTIQLIVNAILEFRFYKCLGNIEHKPLNLEEKERDVLISLLKGNSIKETAQYLNTSARAVEYSKGKFLQKNKAAGDAQFVRCCLESGLLVIFPIRFFYKRVEVFGREQEVYRIRRIDVKKRLDISQINANGFIYCDIESRFWFEYSGIHLSQKERAEGLITALNLSGFDEVFLLHILQADDIVLSEIIMSVSRDIQLISYKEFIQFYQTKGNLQLNEIKSNHPNVLTAGQAVLIGLIAKGVSEDVILKRLKMKKHVLKEQLKIIRMLWNTNSLLAIYMTFLHLKFLRSDR